MLDFLRKDVIGTFSFTNGGSNRTFKKEVLVNGHPAEVVYVAPLAVMVGKLYKVYDQSVKSLKYVLHIGIGEQDVHDNTITNTIELSEQAMENALIEPVITMTFDNDPLDEQFSFESICEMYLANRPKKHVMSLEEVHAEEQKSRYGRQHPYDWLYFDKYKRSEMYCGCGG